jgi:hypothetical protein
MIERDLLLPHVVGELMPDNYRAHVARYLDSAVGRPESTSTNSWQNDLALAKHWPIIASSSRVITIRETDGSRA